MHRDRAIHLGVVPVIAGERMNVAVERQPDQASLRIDERAAGIAADDVVRRDIVERRIRIELRARIEPSLRLAERRLAGPALIHARE